MVEPRSGALQLVCFELRGQELALPIGEVPGAPDMFLACGFVGHGFMMAPIVGKLYGDWLATGDKHEIFDRFTLGRFAAGAAPLQDKEDFNIG